MSKSLSLTLLGLVAGSAAAADMDPGETAIPFIGSLRNVEWKAASDDSLYIRGGKGEWYFVRTTNRCTRLRAARAIGFQASALNQLDRHGAILVQGVRCPVASVVRSGEPPKKARKAA
ncbi:MAG TPA: DUF6491 family protein [Allosphingosinicella sp.]|nr:DUF6491 family protein [Allosphingosinicella sp.]